MVGVGKMTVWAETGETELFTITNGQGCRVTLSSLGAAIVAIEVPDSHGNIANVVVARPITATETWEGHIEGDDSVKFTLRGTSSPDKAITYVWRADNTLEIYLEGDVQNFICGGCFNLDGASSANVHDNSLWINAARFVTPDGIPAQVKGTPLDFTTAHPLSRLAEAEASNPGATWLINDWEEGLMQEAAVLASHTSGRQLSLFTTAPQLSVGLVPDATLAPAGVILACPAPRLAFLEFKTLR